MNRWDEKGGAPPDLFERATQITLVGRVVSQNEGPAKLLLKVQDDTGVIDVNHWLNEDQDQVRACMRHGKGACKHVPATNDGMLHHRPVKS